METVEAVALTIYSCTDLTSRQSHGGERRWFRPVCTASMGWSI